MLWQDEAVHCISRPVDLPYTELAPESPNVSMDGRYYEGGVSSVYFWDLDDGFAGVVLLKKSMRASTARTPFSNATDADPTHSHAER